MATDTTDSMNLNSVLASWHITLGDIYNILLNKHSIAAL